MKSPLLRTSLALCLFAFPAALLAQKVAPKPLALHSPGYPEELTDTGMDGVAEVDFTIKADGSVGEAELAMANHRAFGRAALAAVRSWKFEPGTRDGVPADMRASQKLTFTAPSDQRINAMARRKVFVKLEEEPVGEKDFPAKKLKVKRPARPMLPPQLRAAGVEEKVQVKFVVAPNGTTLNPQVVSTLKHKELETPALQTVAMMSYEPPVKDGKPVYVETTTTLNFTNERPGGGDFGGMGGMGGGRRGMGGMGGGFGGGGEGGSPDE